MSDTKSSNIVCAVYSRSCHRLSVEQFVTWHYSESTNYCSQGIFHMLQCQTLLGSASWWGNKTNDIVWWSSEPTILYTLNAESASCWFYYKKLCQKKISEQWWQFSQLCDGYSLAGTQQEARDFQTAKFLSKLRTTIFLYKAAVMEYQTDSCWWKTTWNYKVTFTMPELHRTVYN